ncbi:16S rRNA (uracil(1498)-N(3))-methyltransferase [Paracrocinitomix mangrovi]|uniref:RsmE family RNA methyltransferase n=1 Tax=Paracrocinitomix mangrovi TaxID=2862509 RepID=UPI001C8ED3E4|nr:RsmE family RNA methyltransferase [Paracrocinitomix mangrovi]UKN02817.1 16S rRNA (uracil(1498)-N(3))-methyltransferase [Paracrocinitomix mangrovi]
MQKAKHTFFCGDIEKGSLNEDESFHASKVMRLMSGDLINIIDGKGNSYIAKISTAVKKEVQFEIVRKLEKTASPLNVHLVIAPTKNMDRFSFVVEKATEMGIKKITPIYSQNSERKILKTEKIKKSMIAAIKQSGNLYLPELYEIKSFNEFIKSDLGESVKLIAHCNDDADKSALKDLVKSGKEFVILIGPEGDFTPEEVILAKEKGFQAISLGDSRFRTETAAILACHTVYLLS